MADIQDPAVIAKLAKALAPFADAQLAVLTRTVLTPPVGVAIGSRYIIPATATGVWLTHKNAIAERVSGGWRYTVPARGMSAWITDENFEAFWDGLLWRSDGSSDGGGDNGTVTRAYISRLNKRMPCRLTYADGQRACDIAMAATPVVGGYVQILVNGLGIDSIGDGSKLSDCFFSGDGGFTARLLSEIRIGDVLYWNGSIAGYQLSVSDTVSFLYEIA